MALDRRRFLESSFRALGVGAMASVLTPSARAQPRSDRNVLFIAVDDLRPQLGCYGHAMMRTPNIDRLAGMGTTFLRAYCQQAVCAPSRASVMSGARPDTTRVYDLDTPLRESMPDVLTLPQHFRENGYTSISLGKIYHHRTKDDPDGWSEPPWMPKAAFPGYASEEINAERRRRWDESGREGGLWNIRGPATEAADLPDEVYPDAKIATAAIESMDALAGDPFFLAVGFMKPHLPFAAPKRYWDLYDPADIDLADNPFAPEGCPPIALHNWGELRQYWGIPQEGDLTDEQARELVHGYYACTSLVDAQVGRLLDAMEERGLLENTSIMLWGDHGWQLGEHGLWCKHSNFETSVHAPMLCYDPERGIAGSRTEALTEFVDMYPSLCELAGLDLPSHLEGDSFVPLMEDPAREWKPAALSQYPRGRTMGYSLRTDRYRYTEWIHPDGEAAARELYDHDSDPAENTNLADAPTHAETVSELSALLREAAGL